jgi:PRTRC genetic system protein B
MPTVEFDSDPTVRLTSALLIYKSGSYDDAETVVTQHDVKDGMIQPGAPLDLEAFRQLIDGKTKAQSSGGWTWRFPRLLAENGEWVVWWSPAGVKSVFIGRDGSKPGVHKAWIPPLVWAASRSTPNCYLFAYDGDSSPTPQTDVYRPQFGPKGGLNHIHSDSRICVGNMKLNGFTPESWERAFWESRFKEPGNLIHTKPYAFKKAFTKIGSLTSALARCGSSD